MAENSTPQNRPEDEISVEELDAVAGGAEPTPGPTIIINAAAGCGGGST